MVEEPNKYSNTTGQGIASKKDLTWVSYKPIYVVSYILHVYVIKQENSLSLE